MWTSMQWSRMLCALTLTAWVCAVTVNVSAASIPTVEQQYDSAKYHPKSANSQTNGTSTKPGPGSQLRDISKPVSNPKDKNPDYAIWDPRGWNPNTVIAGATVIYALVAIFQLGAIRRQAYIAEQSAHAAKQSADIAYRILILAHPPELIVRNVQIQRPDMRKITLPDDLRKVQAFMGQLLVPNTGKTTATIVHAGCWVFLIEGELPMERPYDGFSPNTQVIGPREQGKLLPGDSGVMLISSAASPVIKGGQDPMESLQGHPKQVNLYVMGWVFYEDDIGNRRRTAFCREWDWPTQNFVKVDNPNYEHEE